MIHVSDSVARFQPIGPANERWEAGQWRIDVEGNYYGSDRPGIEEIFEHREKMFAKHPHTRFVNAHIAMISFDLKHVGEMLDQFPNTDVEVSARIQDLGRQPFSGRAFLIKYHDRVLFGSDGDPSRKVERFWTPHWRYFETDDEYFDNPAQMLSPLGAPLQGRWAIHGAYLPDEAIRKSTIRTLSSICRRYASLSSSDVRDPSLRSLGEGRQDTKPAQHSDRVAEPASPVRE